MIGPFDFQTFKQEKWTDLRDKIQLLGSTYTDTNEIQELLQFLSEINNCSDYRAYFGDYVIKDYFFREFLPSVAKTLVNKRQEDQDMAEKFRKCLEQMIIFWFKVIEEDDTGLAEMARTILNPDHVFYKVNKLEKPIAPKTNIPMLIEKKALAPNNFSLEHSTFLDLFVTFEKTGGFEILYQRINNFSNYMSLDNLNISLSIIKNLCPFLSKEICIEYLKRLQKAVYENLLSRSETQIGDFTQDKIKRISQTVFGLFSKYISSQSEALVLINTLNSKICELCLTSSLLDTQLEGINMYLDLIRQTKPNNRNQCDVEILKKSDFHAFLKDHKILTKIFDSSKDVNLISRSEDLLGYFIEEKLLGHDDFKLVWDHVKNEDISLRAIIYNIFTQKLACLETALLDHILSEIIKTPNEKITIEEIKLLSGLSKLPRKSKLFANKVNEFYWRIAFNSTNDINVTEYVLSRLYEMTKEKSVGHEQKTKFLDVCIENILKGLVTLPFIKIMKEIIKENNLNLSSSKDSSSGMSCADYIFQQSDIVSLLIKQLKSFKTSLTERIEDQTIMTEKVLESLMHEGVSYKDHITARVELICSLLARKSSRKTCSIQNELHDLWSGAVQNAFFSSERTKTYNLINTISSPVKGQPPFCWNDLLKFFMANFNSIALQSCRGIMTIEGFECFKRLYSSINLGFRKSGEKNTKHTLNLDIEKDLTSLQHEFESIGTDTAWIFYLTVDEDKVAEEALCFLNNTPAYFKSNNDLSGDTKNQYLEDCRRYLMQTVRDKTSFSEKEFTYRCLRCLRLIQDIMDESEKQGIADLQPHSRLNAGSFLTFTIINNMHNVPLRIPKNSKVTLYSHSTVLDLRMEVAKMYRVAYDQFILLKSLNSEEIGNKHNGKSLLEAGLKDNTKIAVNEKSIGLTPQINLLVDNKTLNPTLRIILLEWFAQFSENDQITPENFAGFGNFVTKSYDYHYLPSNTSIEDAFENFDDDRDCLISQENFLSFYLRSCKQRPSVVWNNLYTHYYTNDLRKVTDIKPKAAMKSLVRHILSMDDEFLELMFLFLDYDEKIANEAWKLLNRLPTSLRVFSDLIRIKGMKEAKDSVNPDWNGILNLHSKYRLLYSLQVIQCLINCDDTENKQTKNRTKVAITESLWVQNQELLNQKGTWQNDFVSYGGFSHLLRIIGHYLKYPITPADPINQSIVANSLKILRRYLSTTFEWLVQDVCNKISFKEIFSLFIDYKTNNFHGGLKLTPEEEAILKDKEMKNLHLVTLLAPIKDKILHFVRLRTISKTDIETISVLGSYILDNGELLKADLKTFQDSLSVLIMAILFYNNNL